MCKRIKNRSSFHQLNVYGILKATLQWAQKRRAVAPFSPIIRFMTNAFHSRSAENASENSIFAVNSLDFETFLQQQTPRKHFFFSTNSSFSDRSRERFWRSGRRVRKRSAWKKSFLCLVYNLAHCQTWNARFRRLLLMIVCETVCILLHVESEMMLFVVVSNRCLLSGWTYEKGEVDRL